VARLILESGSGRREVKLAGPVTVGRSPSVTIPLDDKTLSREHTQFYLDRGRPCVRDLESKNGTLLNGQLLKQPTALKPGDKVRVGAATFTVVFEPGDPTPAVTASVPPQRVQAAAATPVRPARTRPIETGPGGFTVFVQRLVLLGVVVGGAWLSKGLFTSFVLPMLPK
jgi:pSer/pThr/pTyr-binding forkhead associated (FHA) protein